METQKKVIELTPEQAEKVELLESNGISVGQAIDMLFDIRDGLQKEDMLSQIKDVENVYSAFSKLKDTSLDSEQKQKIVDKEFSNVDETYDMKIQRVKHSISWFNDFFKF